MSMCLQKLYNSLRLSAKKWRFSTCATQGFSLIEVLILIALVTVIFIPVLALLYSFTSNTIIQHIQSPEAKLTEVIHDGLLWYEQYVLGFRKSYLANYVYDSGNCGTAFSGTETHVQQTLYTKEDLGFTTSTAFTGFLSIGQYMYMSSNSSSTTDPDISVFDSTMHIQKSYDVGPGLTSIISRGRYIIGINSGTTYQYVVFSKSPTGGELTEVYKRTFPLGTSSTTPMSKIAIVQDEYIFVGTEKSIYPEVYIFRLSTGELLGTIELGYGVNDIAIYNGVLFVFGPNNPEIDFFDIRNILLRGVSTQAIQKIGSFDLVGGSGNAKVARIFGDTLYVGRTKGNSELLAFTIQTQLQSENILPGVDISSTSSLVEHDAGVIFSTLNIDKQIKIYLTEKDSYKIGWSVDSMQIIFPYMYVFTSNEWEEMHFFDIKEKLKKITSIDAPGRIQYSSCYKRGVYALFGKNSDTAFIKIVHEE